MFLFTTCWLISGIILYGRHFVLKRYSQSRILTMIMNVTSVVPEGNFICRRIRKTKQIYYIGVYVSISLKVNTMASKLCLSELYQDSLNYSNPDLYLLTCLTRKTGKLFHKKY